MFKLSTTRYVLLSGACELTTTVANFIFEENPPSDIILHPVDVFFEILYPIPIGIIGKLLLWVFTVILIRRRINVMKLLLILL